LPEDGDSLDVIVIHDAATFPGLVLACRIIGILQIQQKSKGKAERNDRLFAAPERSHSELAFATCGSFRSRSRKNWRNSSSPQTSLTTLILLAGRRLRWR